MSTAKAKRPGPLFAQSINTQGLVHPVPYGSTEPHGLGNAG
jgi:hypothetical protein